VITTYSESVRTTSPLASSTMAPISNVPTVGVDSVVGGLDSRVSVSAQTIHKRETGCDGPRHQ
jgi:hypothetical protein